MMLEALTRYARFLERLSAQSLPEFGDYLAPDARFVDPFNDVRGVDAVQRVFRTMVEDLDDLKVVATHVAMADTSEASGRGAPHVGFIHWRMSGALVRMSRRPFDVTGVSKVELDADGRVLSHVDYWDVASGLYEMFPVLGPALRWVRRRLAVA